MNSKRGSLAYDNTENVKVTVLGNSGVGKSSIVARYISGVFTDSIISTTGANYSQKLIDKDSNKLRLNIWDTAGQEKYRALGQKYYKDAYIIIIIYDITNIESFESIKTDWYNDIQKYGEKYYILAIAGNKSDLYEDEKVNEEEARKYAKEIGASFFIISAYTGDGIDNMFCQLADLYLSREFEKKKKELNNQRSSSISLRRTDFKKQENKHKGCCM